jgi:hypothetical protein
MNNATESFKAAKAAAKKSLKATGGDTSAAHRAAMDSIKATRPTAAAIAEWAAKYGVDVVKRAADKVS